MDSRKSHKKQSFNRVINQSRRYLCNERGPPDTSWSNTTCSPRQNAQPWPSRSRAATWDASSAGHGAPNLISAAAGRAAGSSADKLVYPWSNGWSTLSYCVWSVSLQYDLSLQYHLSCSTSLPGSLVLHISNPSVHSFHVMAIICTYFCCYATIA